MPDNLHSMHISAKTRDYVVHFSSLFGTLERIASDSDSDSGSGSIVIADTNVLDAWPKLFKGLAEKIPVIPVKASEEIKSLRAIEEVIGTLFAHHFRKSGKIYVVGGGTVQDLAGFLASVVFRGVEWVFIPTTLSAQGDSCIGSKTSINVQGFKNLIGTFWPPSEVIIDTELLNSLPKREINAGLGELAHYFMLGSVDDVRFFTSQVDVLQETEKIQPELIKRSLEIKKPFIEADEFDRGVRQLLNLGHTFAHGIESASGNKIVHGEAVALGLVMCSRLSHALGLLDILAMRLAEEMLLPLIGRIPFVPFEVRNQITAMGFDKKNFDGDIQLILLNAIGSAHKAPLGADNPLLESSIVGVIELWKDQTCRKS